MSYRAKHRRAALVRRIEQGRMIKSDLTPQGRQRYWDIAQQEGLEPSGRDDPESISNLMAAGPSNKTARPRRARRFKTVSPPQD